MPQHREHGGRQPLHEEGRAAHAADDAAHQHGLEGSCRVDRRHLLHLPSRQCRCRRTSGSTIRGRPHAGGFAATNDGMGHPGSRQWVDRAAADPFDPFSRTSSTIRVEATQALPGRPARQYRAEQTYSLMIHMSESLGVNCTFCHNTRNFSGWSEGTPQRSVAWHGLELVWDHWVPDPDPLRSTYPANRLGPRGDSPKLDCGTCHQGVSKPLYGAGIAKDYPELGGAAAP